MKRDFKLSKYQGNLSIQCCSGKRLFRNNYKIGELNLKGEPYLYNIENSIIGTNRAWEQKLDSFIFIMKERSELLCLNKLPSNNLFRSERESKFVRQNMKNIGVNILHSKESY